MEDSRTELAEGADALLDAAERFEHGAGSTDCVPFVATSLASVAAALDALSRAVDAAARSIVPPGDVHETIGARYTRAAAAWPGPPHVGAPSHEQQARLLAALHDARTALGTASKSAWRARDVVALTVCAPSDGASQLHRIAQPVTRPRVPRGRVPGVSR